MVGYVCHVPGTPLDDGDDCTINDEETILDFDGRVCVPCAGTPLDCATGSTSVVACDDGDAGTVNDEQTILDCDGSICIPCAGTPANCENGTTTVRACDDGNDCTINDEETILDQNGQVCIPCTGTPLDCATGPTSVVTCDDGDPNTINDQQTILDCDGSICISCAGIAVDCDSGTRTVRVCDDGNDCTINDEETILDENGQVCIPCAGTPLDCATGSTSVVACDDGDADTVNDQQTILDCDGSICLPCAGISADCANGATTTRACDDGNDCTINDQETILDQNGTVCIPCAGTPTNCDNGATAIVACDDGDPNTINDQQTILNCDGSICIPCSGTICAVFASIQEPIGLMSCDLLDTGVILDGTLSSTGDHLTYQWTLDGNLIGQTIMVEVFDEGVYQLEVTDTLSGCSQSQRIELSVPVVELTPIVDIQHEKCTDSDDGLIQIDTVFGGVPPFLFSLNGSTLSTNRRFENLVPGTYTLMVEDANACSFETVLLIEEAVGKVLDLGEDQEIGLGASFQIIPLANFTPIRIEWAFEESLSCLDCFTPIAQPTRETTYMLSMEDAEGCIISDQLTIRIKPNRSILVANSFSPNQDGINDFLVVRGGDEISQVVSFTIFNKWGELVFNRTNFPPNDEAFGWDGTFNGANVGRGVFVFVIEAELKDGTTKIVSGDVAVVK